MWGNFPLAELQKVKYSFKMEGENYEEMCKKRHSIHSQLPFWSDFPTGIKIVKKGVGLGPTINNVLFFIIPLSYFRHLFFLIPFYL